MPTSSERSIAPVAIVSAPAHGGSSATIDAWAAESGIQVVVLPEAGYRAHPGADAAERRRLGRRDQRQLHDVFAVLLRGTGPAPRIDAFFVTQDEVTGQAGRAWLERVVEAARDARLDLPRAVRLPDTGDLDRELLDGALDRLPL